MMKQIDLAKIRANMKASKDFHIIELEKELDDDGLYTQIAAAFFADLVQKNHSLEQLFDIITHMSELALAYAQMQAEVVKATESGKPANLN